MERPHPQVRRHLLPHQPRDTALHLLRRLVRKRQRQDFMRRHPLAQQLRDAVRQHPRLPRPGSRNHQRRPLRVHHGGLLAAVQFIDKIHVFCSR